ncbi:MAG: hypothetical protein ACRDI3_06870 [Actinomycetota bacterium]
MRHSSSKALKVVSGSFAAALMLTGLAYAAGEELSVTDPAEETLTTETQAVTTEVSDSDSLEATGKSVSDAVHAVIDAATERGCEFGQAVAAAASVNRQGLGGSDVDPCSASDATATTATEDVAVSTEETSVTGGSKASEASGGRSDMGAENAGTHDDAGRASAAEKSGRP